MIAGHKSFSIFGWAKPPRSMPASRSTGRSKTFSCLPLPACIRAQTFLRLNAAEPNAAAAMRAKIKLDTTDTGGTSRFLTEREIVGFGGEKVERSRGVSAGGRRAGFAGP